MQSFCRLVDCVGQSENLVEFSLLLFPGKKHSESKAPFTLQDFCAFISSQGYKIPINNRKSPTCTVKYDKNRSYPFLTQCPSLTAQNNFEAALCLLFFTPLRLLFKSMIRDTLVIVTDILIWAYKEIFCFVFYCKDMELGKLSAAVWTDPEGK